MANIKTNLLTINKYSRPGTKLSRVKGIVVHYVGNPGSSAEANRNYFNNLKAGTSGVYASAHYIIGLKGEIIKCIPTDEMAYHVGAKNYKTEAVKKLSSYPNDCTLGIECCHPDSTGKPTPETYKSLVELVRELIKTYNLDPAEDLYIHYDITGKDCHRYYRNNPSEWQKFKKEVSRSEIDSKHKANVDQLVKVGIIGSPDLWYDTAKITPANMEALISKMAQYTRK